MTAIRTVLITGATGLIGTRLTEILLAKGYNVRHLSRRASSRIETFTWDVDKQTIQEGALHDVDAIVHLAGANVAEKRWTKERKQQLINSRIDSTKLIYHELKKGNHRVRSFVCASGVGYYGWESEAHLFTENSPGGDDFLARLTAHWEAEANRISDLGIRVVCIRIGIVLSKNEGALAPIVKTVRNLVGAPLGNGKQFISWIHHEDICRMFLHVLENQNLIGAYNGVADEPVTNAELTKAVATELNKPLVLPNVPPFALKLAFGEMAELVLQGSRVSNEKILSTGYQLKFPRLKEALADLLH